MERLPVSLVGLKHSFGERTIDNAEIEDKYGLPKGWVLEKTGKEKGHSWDNGPESPTEASLECFRLLLKETNIDQSQIKAIFGTTNPITIDGKTRDESLTVTFAHRAGFSEETKVCDEGWGCGGSAVGIDSMNTWLQNQPVGTYALYVTQDWPTKMVKDRNVEALFSDAVSVSLWSNDSEGIVEITDVFSVNSTIADEALGIVGGFWEMDGREVSKSASAVPALVAEKLQIDLKDYDVVPHQPNAKLLETMEGIYGIHLHKKVAQEHGNPTCSGAFIALEKVLDDRKKGIGPNTDKDILVMPFGAGGVGGFILRNKKAGI
jgi:3-oxoacyl-[acyl-carrier-protein] synthase III